MQQTQYGHWSSPISEEMAAGRSMTFGEVITDGQDIYWTEMRPWEKGRSVLVKKSPNQAPVDVLPQGFNVRTRVHEYGGAAFTVQNGRIYFIHFSDQRLYVAEPGSSPTPLTDGSIRLADFTWSEQGLIAVAESHINPEKVSNFLVLIDPDSGEMKTLAEGYDFYAAPAVNAASNKLAFIAWHHPNMPWDNTQLFCADLTAAGLTHIQAIDADFRDQSFFQPQWGEDNVLYVVSDKSNWWNLYRVEHNQLVPLFTVDSEIGLPLWSLGRSRFVFYQQGLVCAFAVDGKTALHYFDFNTKKITTWSLPYSDFSQIRRCGDKIVCLAGAPDKPTALIEIDANQQYSVIKQNMDLTVPPGYISQPQHIEFPVNNRKSYAYFYPPTNQDCEGLEGTLPPLIVKSHGGPTGNCGCNLNLEIQYWTSRGFAFVDVNYTGSTGYGRAYRHALNGQWGVFDVEDCAGVAHFLADEKRVNPDQLMIMGGSAGGYTTLAALVFTDTFAAGASSYGISMLAAMAEETHKFESRYLDNLIGPYPQQAALYEQRSPINHVDKLNCPVIFFQGSEDKVVPPNQAEKMVDALKEKGIKTRYCLFEGEQHGFRQADTRITVLKEQLAFFKQTLD